MNTIIGVFTTDKLAEISKGQLQELISEAMAIKETREDLLMTTAKELKNIEQERTHILHSKLDQLSEALKKINYFPSLVLTRTLQVIH